MSDPIIKPSEAQAQARAKSALLASAFEDVFGQPRGRSSAQKAVIGHLEVCAGDDQNSYRFNDSMDGMSRIAAGIHRDGAKSILRVIDRQLLIASKSQSPRKAPPKTIR